VDGRHPRVELLVETARQEADVGAPDRHEGPVHGELLVGARLHDLLEPRGDRHHRLPCPGTAVEGDDADRRVEQELEGEALLLGAGPQAPRLGRGGGQQLDDVAGAPHESGLRTGPEHGELVLMEHVQVGTVRGVNLAVRVQAVDRLAGNLGGDPPHRPRHE
jgi:hypothetical protein